MAVRLSGCKAGTELDVLCRPSRYRFFEPRMYVPKEPLFVDEGAARRTKGFYHMRYKMYHRSPSGLHKSIIKRSVAQPRSDVSHATQKHDSGALYALHRHPAPELVRTS
jgi:hypothetical protein